MRIEDQGSVAVALLRSDAVAQCAVDRGSKMWIEDQRSVALLLRFAKGRGRGIK